MGKIFKTKLTTATIVLIPACIGINYLGKLFASLLKLPLWLDCIGTCIGACLGGPVSRMRKESRQEIITTPGLLFR